MNTLIFGAGVLGSLYASLLKQAGKEVTILARGKRLQELKNHGLVINNVLTKTIYESDIDIIEEQLSEKNNFDLILVILQKNQIKNILPQLAKHSTNATIVFLGNNGTGIEEYREYIDPSRILLGFPSAAGRRAGHIMEVVFDPKKSKITIGDPTGKTITRLKKVQSFLKQAGIPVRISKDIDAWLKTHIALISPLANVYYMLKSKNQTIQDSSKALDLVVKAIIEGVKVLRKLDYPILPWKFRLILLMPKRMKKILMNMYNSELYDIALKGHADYAVEEMRLLANEFQILIKQADIPTPAIDELYTFLPKN